MMKYLSLHGTWTVQVNGLEAQPVKIPGTLDESGIGFPDEGGNQWHPENTLGNEAEFSGQRRILTRLTRKVSYEGPASYSRTVTLAEDIRGSRVFLEVERSRELTLAVNRSVVSSVVPGTVSTPHVFEVTGLLQPGENTVTLCCDNAYPSWPHDAIVFSSAATDETQTNWNGLIGEVRLRLEQPQFFSAARVYPSETTAEVVLTIDCATPYAGTLRLRSSAFAQGVDRHVSLPAGIHALRFADIPLSPDAKRWDEGQGNLHEMAVEGDGLAELTVRFGLRTFSAREGRLALNNRHFFLRSEANCCVFPETGHMPMDVASWKRILNMYRAYGVNSMRFHSHCPPEAAFAAADELGMMMQPELSHWNPRSAFEDEKSWAYYSLEMTQILLTYANHPSFVMMTWGNELQAGALGHKRMALLLERARRLDPTRLYAQGSNNHLGRIGPDPASDFYTGANVYDTQMRATSANMRGYLNETYPDATAQFDPVVDVIREEFAGPVFSFEVGQYEVLPDFDEWEHHTGITRPDNYDHIRNRVMQAGWMADWKRRVAATGELSLLAYREEVESVLRSEKLSGISLLGLQDFPGQGTALVGMLNAHLQPKPFPFAQPERFRMFFSDVVPLALLEKYTFLSSKTLRAEIKLANYGKQSLNEPCVARLLDGDAVLAEHSFPEQVYPCGKLLPVGDIAFPLETVEAPAQLRLTIAVGDATNSYPVWVYPDRELTYPADVVATQSSAVAKEALEAGRKVFLTPSATEDNFPNAIKPQFTTDFWSVGTFAKQEGFMGLLMDPAHPVFAGFPTEPHSNWQWWPMCQGRAMVLPQGTASLVTALDCYARMRNMGMLVEGRVGKGQLLVSSMGLLDNLAYPEVRALLQSILNYMASEAFKPEQDLQEVAWLFADK